jgi:thiaminase
MVLFHQSLLKNAEQIWIKMLKRPFLKSTADCTISDNVFKSWIQQDYIFVREAIPFIGILLAKSPVPMRTNFIQILSALDTELGLFRKNAEEHGIDIEDIEPSPVCHAYIQFLLTTAYNRTFLEGFTMLYAAEKVYLDSWMVVKKNLKGESPWQDFINNWTSPEFQNYVEWLGSTLDELVQDFPPRELKKLERLFMKVVQYEYLFWDMAAGEKKWPV